MSFSFDKLNLSGVQASNASSILRAGRYLCTARNATLSDTKSGGKYIEIELHDDNNMGSIKAYLNVYIPKSEQATRIGREQLKSLLTYGGHADPDNIGKHGVASINGLKTGVLVVSETYTKDGEERTGSRVKGFLDPSGFTQPKSSGLASSSQPEPVDDDIPF
tara:strand:- start:16946 stop:17434 length:489 start_codon:yes stop_codon:yes gene_type:complete